MVGNMEEVKGEEEREWVGRDGKGREG